MAEVLRNWEHSHDARMAALSTRDSREARRVRRGGRSLAASMSSGLSPAYLQEGKIV